MIRSTLAQLALVMLLAGCGDKPATPPAGADEHAGEAHNDDHDAGAASSGGDKHAESEAGHEEGPPSTTIAADVAKQSGVEVAAVAAGTIADEHEVQGLLTPVEGRVAQVTARFPGPIRRCAPTSATVSRRARRWRRSKAISA